MMKWGEGDEGDSDDGESVDTLDDGTVAGSEHNMTDADTKSEDGLSEASRATPEPDTILEPPPIEEPEPEPPSPAPEELWEYLKEHVTHDGVISVDELVEKLVTTVSSIPQPYLKSVVKESIKKQKSIDEDESHHDGLAEGENPPADGEPPAEGAPSAEGEAPAAPPAEGAPAEGAPAEVPAEGSPTEAAPPSEQPPAESAPSEAPPSEPEPVIQSQPAVVEAAA